jgi:hypothetical protein
VFQICHAGGRFLSHGIKRPLSFSSARCILVIFLLDSLSSCLMKYIKSNELIMVVGFWSIVILLVLLALRCAFTVTPVSITFLMIDSFLIAMWS